MPVSGVILHEAEGRLRLRIGRGADATDARAYFEQVDGVHSVRVSVAARSVTLEYDGRATTRRAILDSMAAIARHRRGVEVAPARASETIPVEASLLAAALSPVLPPAARPVAAVALVAARAWAAWRQGSEPTAIALDSIALASTALTGHPLTATTSVLLGGIAERRRNALLARTDRLLARLATISDEPYRIRRGGDALRLRAVSMQPGDRVSLAAGQIAPADGIVLEGRAEIGAELPGDVPARWIDRGDRINSGARVLGGRVEVRLERTAARSRAARLRDHVRHALRTRDVPGPLTPDLERLVAVPITAAGLVLALTGDAARTASMLQADPQQGIALANPVAREAALYAVARRGVLLAGLEGVERLAAADTFAFEDVGVLTDRRWHVDTVLSADGRVDQEQAQRWLARLTGGDEHQHAEGWPDEQVVAWREHGAVLVAGDRMLHVGGAAVLARTWGLHLDEPDRHSLVRRLGVVDNGRLLATIHMRCPLHARVRESFTRLRALGVRRIAVFTEDLTERPAQALLGLGADAVVCRSRAEQERWLDEAVERDERVALVHTGLRNLLPPGGLSLCPIDAEAGAHGVLLAEPLASLLEARATAQRLRRALRRRFGGSVAVNSALMVAAAMRWLPPIATAGLKHAFAFGLLYQSAALAGVDRRAADAGAGQRALAGATVPETGRPATTDR
jgi:cation transport ATPase